MSGCVPHVISPPLFRQLLQRRLFAELELLSAPSAATTWWAQCKMLCQTPPEDATHCAVCTGRVRGLGWSWLAVSKHFFGIYLSETLQCKPLVHGSPSAGSHLGPNLDTQTCPEQTLILERAVFCPGSVQRSKRYTYIVFPRSRLMMPRAAQPAAAAACEFCIWYSLAVIWIHWAMQGAIWGMICCVRDCKDTKELMLYRHPNLPYLSSGWKVRWATLSI